MAKTKKKKDIEEESYITISIREVISNVNSTISGYERNYVSVSRVPRNLSNEDLEIERCTTLKQYIEARFNYESYISIPELREMQTITGGHLFKCSEVDGENRIKHSYRIAKMSLLSMDDVDRDSVDDTFEEKLKEVEKFLGGNCIEFNNVVKKVKFNIINV
jgi:hypothetical protein